MKSILSVSMLLTIVSALAAQSPTTDTAAGDLKLYACSRVETPAGSGQVDCTYKTLAWDPKKTAVIVCDMWDQHWCKGAAARVAEMAPRVNDFLTEARKRGVLIVHAPSECMKAYENHPARLRAQNAPNANVPDFLRQQCQGLDAEKQAKWPIDQSDGGCDCTPPCPKGRPWTSQIDTLKIADGDAISDSGVEIGNLLAQRGIENVMLVGVHENMCVIGRPFGLRNMVRLGKNVVLVRDLTDAMYNPRHAPQVSHVRGTELVSGAHREVRVPDDHQQRPAGRTGLPLWGGQAAARHSDRQRRRILQRRDAARLRPVAPRAVRLLLQRVGE